MSQQRYSIPDMADILHQVSSLYMSSNLMIDYGTGEKYTPVEVHFLKYIVDHPGKTTTDLSRDWDKTKAAISQMMKKLEQKGLIYREPAPDSEKKQLYRATPKGEKINELHEAYDTITFGKTMEPVLNIYSEEEIGSCFDILTELCRSLRRKQYHSK